MQPQPRIKGQHVGIQIVTSRSSKFELLLFWAMVLCGGSLLIAVFLLAAQLYYTDKTFQAHLNAGGVDDPDVVFGHFNPLMFFVPVAVLVSFIGSAVSFVGWLLMKMRCLARKPKPPRQWRES